MIWEKAQELFQMDEARTMDDDFKGITAERHELMEAGYFYRAKLIVLTNLWREKKGLGPIEYEQLEEVDERTVKEYEEEAKKMGKDLSDVPSNTGEA